MARDILTPEELAQKHPRLYHITRPWAVASIKKHGLLSASKLLKLFGIPSEQRKSIEGRRRATNIDITHPIHGFATLTDNGPLSEAALAQCLDDGLSPADWMRLLNQRVFFWVDQSNVANHLRANIKSGEERVVLIFDTLSIVRAHHQQTELAPINTGSTIRRPARRGLGTFSPAHLYTYSEWRQLRGGRDHIKELTIRDGIADIDNHLIECVSSPKSK